MQEPAPEIGTWITVFEKESVSVGRGGGGGGGQGVFLFVQIRTPLQLEAASHEVLP